MSIISKEAADHLFTDARSHNAWQPKEVPNELLHKLYELMKFAPTSANCSPLRIVFVKSPEAKAKLKPFMSEGNVAKTMQAPVTAILAFDMDFASHLVIPPFLTGFARRIYAANFSFCAGVMPPMPMLGRSLL